MQILHKECCTVKVFKQRKQLICNLKCHVDTTAILSKMVKTLKSKTSWYLTHKVTER